MCPLKFISVVPGNNQTQLLTPGFKGGFTGGLMSFELVLPSFFFSPLRALNSPVGGGKVLWEVETDDRCRKKAAITRRRRTEPFVGCHQGRPWGLRRALNMSGSSDTQSQRREQPRPFTWLLPESHFLWNPDPIQNNNYYNDKVQENPHWLALIHSCSSTSFS